MEQKFDIVLFADGLPFEHDQLESKALGGSETCALSAAKTLAKRGHKVTLFCRCENQGLKDDGVHYRAIGSQPGYTDLFFQYITVVPIDVLVVQRIPDMLHVSTTAKIKIMWMHDLGWSAYTGKVRSVMWNVDEIWALTNFHKEQMHQVYGGPKETYHVQHSGVAIEHFNDKTFQSIRKIPKKLFYSSRPERGLDTLLFEIMPRLISKDPEFHLYLAGYDLCPNDPNMKAYYDRCYTQAENLSDNVTNLGHLTKTELYKQMASSECIVYPTNFEETFCLTAIEAQRAGTPFITTSNIGALPETLHPQANIFVDVDVDKETQENDLFRIKFKHDVAVRTEKYYEAFTQAVLDYTNSPGARKEMMRKKGISFARHFTWDNAIKSWENHLIEMFAERVKNKYTLAMDFLKNNDVIAAQKLCQQEDLTDIGNAIDEQYLFCFNESSIKKHYTGEEIDTKHLKETSVACQNAHRVTAIKEFIKKHKEVEKILDFGCGEGVVTFPVSNLRPEIKIHGVDISPVRLSVAQNSMDRAKHKNVSFQQLDVNIDQVVEQFEPESFDTIILSEVLEHIPNPSKLMDKLETLLKPDGWVILTTPHGAFEAVVEPLHSDERRSHLYNFDRHDLVDLFGNKKGLDIGFLPAERHKLDPSKMLSHAFIRYQKNGKLCGTINYQRKFSFQAPRQTVSVCMMGKDNEESILACLNSINMIADEIRFVDTGSTDGTKKIVSRFPKAKIIKGDNPLEKGFDVVRNQTIQNAKGDWIFWIDTDEKLVDGGRLFKYLQHNSMNGYSIPQHHFTVEPPNAFKPDLPVRCFRNNKGIKFFGVVHEHPELALNKSVGCSICVPDVNIAHPAYLSETIRQSRFIRNFPLVQKDREKNPGRMLGLFMWLRDLIHWSRHHLMMNQGQMTKEVYSWCTEVISIVSNEFFKEDTGFDFMLEDATNYYSEACILIDIGFDSDTGLAFSRRNPNPIPAKRIRFATIDDYEKYIAIVMKQRVSPFKGKYV